VTREASILHRIVLETSKIQMILECRGLLLIVKLRSSKPPGEEIFGEILNLGAHDRALRY
jgi:hypothetical protein